MLFNIKIPVNFAAGNAKAPQGRSTQDNNL